MKISSNHWLISRPIAHRGFWNDKVNENSIKAYQNAVDNGYPIEIDLFESIDGVLYSFHDDNLLRMTGENGNIFEKTSAEIDKLRLNNSNDKIPTFDDVLSICENKVPLLIELKDQPSKTFVKNVLDRLKTYKGEYAIQSFNPLYINQVRKYNKKIIRGILTANIVLKKNKFIRFVISKMPLNFLCKPDFISRSITGLPLPKRKVKHRPVLAWTVTSQKDYESVKPYCNNIIFEHFIPTK